LTDILRITRFRKRRSSFERFPSRLSFAGNSGTFTLIPRKTARVLGFRLGHEHSLRDKACLRDKRFGNMKHREADNRQGGRVALAAPIRGVHAGPVSIRVTETRNCARHEDTLFPQQCPGIVALCLRIAIPSCGAVTDAQCAPLDRIINDASYLSTINSYHQQTKRIVNAIAGGFDAVRSRSRDYMPLVVIRLLIINDTISVKRFGRRSRFLLDVPDRKGTTSGDKSTLSFSRIVAENVNRFLGAAAAESAFRRVRRRRPDG